MIRALIPIWILGAPFVTMLILSASFGSSSSH